MYAVAVLIMLGSAGKCWEVSKSSHLCSYHIKGVLLIFGGFIDWMCGI